MDYKEYSRDELLKMLEKLDRGSKLSSVSSNQNEVEKLQNMLNKLPDICLKVDENLTVIWANKSALQKYAGIIGRHCSLLKQISNAVNDVFEQVLMTGEDQVWSVSIQGEPMEHWENALYPLIFNENQVNEWMILSKDVTEREQLRMKLSHYNDELISARDKAQTATQAKSDFLANTTHEIRTPMNGIMGMIQLLETTNLDSKQREFVDYLKASSDRLLGVVDNIFEISTLEQGNYNIIEEEFNVRDFVKETFNIKEKPAVAKGLSIDYKVSSKAPVKVIADKYRLSQILSNIIDNSIKFSKIGHIEMNLDAEIRDQQNIEMVIRISDTGIGIPEDKLDRIFEQFNQVDNSSTREYGGTGLGLAITKSLVEMMGGTIEVHSTYGVGTTFYLRIPMKISEFEMRKAQEKLAQLPVEIKELGVEEGKVPTILVAEDEMLGRITIKLMLKDKYKVVFAKNGKIAVEKYMESEPDLVLMDIMMPIMNGFEAFDEIEKSVTSRAPIIACTAKVIKTEKEYLMSYGFDDYLSKPIDMKQLHSIIEKHLNRQGY